MLVGVFLKMTLGRKRVAYSLEWPASQVDSGCHQGHQQQGFQLSPSAWLCWGCLNDSDSGNPVPSQAMVFTTEAESCS